MFYVYCEEKYLEDCRESIRLLCNNHINVASKVRAVSDYKRVYEVLDKADKAISWKNAVINALVLKNSIPVNIQVFISNESQGKEYFDSLKDIISILDSYDKFSVISEAERIAITSIDSATKYLEEFFSVITGWLFPVCFSERVALVIRIIEHKLLNKSRKENEECKTSFPHFYSVYFSEANDCKLAYRKIRRDYGNYQDIEEPFVVEKIDGSQQIIPSDNINQQVRMVYYSTSKDIDSIISLSFLYYPGRIILLNWDRLYAIDENSLNLYIKCHKEGLINDNGFVESILHSAYEDILSEKFESTNAMPLACADSVRTGVASGKMIVGDEDISVLRENNERYILIKEELFPSDLEYIALADGIITKSGSSTSHPALIAKQLGKIYLYNCGSMIVSKEGVHIGNTLITKGSMVSIDGKNGYIYNIGLEKKDKENQYSYFKYINSIIYKHLALKVLVNTENADDAYCATQYGGSGVGLYRSEYMGPQELIRRYLVGVLIINDYNVRMSVLNRLKKIWKDELIRFLDKNRGGIFTFRTLDYPSDELLFNAEKIVGFLSDEFNINKCELNNNLEKISEKVGTLGARGVRMSLMYPDLMDSQIRALFEAIDNTDIEKRPNLRIMLPVVTTESEVVVAKKQIEKISKDFDEISYSLGIMVETPRAMYIIEKIAKHIDFISFGTNDLTQLVWGMSRNDYSPIINHYNMKGMLSYNPFEIIDTEVLIPLIQQTIIKAKKNNDRLTVSICGNQSYSSLKYLLHIGFDSISIGFKDVPFAILKGGKLVINESGS